jgi:hypothetical protein
MFAGFCKTGENIQRIMFVDGGGQHVPIGIGLEDQVVVDEVGVFVEERLLDLAAPSGEVRFLELRLHFFIVLPFLLVEVVRGHNF